MARKNTTLTAVKPQERSPEHQQKWREEHERWEKAESQWTMTPRQAKERVRALREELGFCRDRASRSTYPVRYRTRLQYRNTFQVYLTENLNPRINGFFDMIDSHRGLTPKNIIEDNGGFRTEGLR